jgi:hypothetical protein
MELKALVDVALSIGRLERVVHHPASVKWTACPTQVLSWLSSEEVGAQLALSPDSGKSSFCMGEIPLHSHALHPNAKILVALPRMFMDAYEQHAYDDSCTPISAYIPAKG